MCVSEMEDILSLDDEVLQSVYLYHLPPNENHIRLPQLLWQRIRNDLEEYLQVRRSGILEVDSWYHRQFRETAARRYTTNYKKKLHCGLAGYFSGKWAGKIKPLKLYKKKKAEYPNCTRGVHKQPIVYHENYINVRKIRELPFHLVHSKQYQEFVQTVCCSVEWIYYTIKAFGMNATLNELRTALTCIHEDINLTAIKVEDLRISKKRTHKVDSNANEGEDIDTEANAGEKRVEDVIENLENDLQDLEQCQKDMKNVLGILTLTVDAVTSDINNLALQVRDAGGLDMLFDANTENLFGLR